MGSSDSKPDKVKKSPAKETKSTRRGRAANKKKRSNYNYPPAPE
jgi:hypothetical protein